MHLLRRLFSTMSMVFAISILFVGCKAKDTTAGLGQTVAISDVEPMPDGFNRESQRERDLNIGIKLPKGERGSKLATNDMKIENRVGDDFDFLEEEDDEVERLPADINLDYTVNILDLLAVINEYSNACPPSPEACPTDIDEDSRTGVGDLVMVISNWGVSVDPPPAQEEEEDEEEEVDEGGGLFASSELVTPDPIALDSLYYDFYSRNDARAQLAIELDQGALTRDWNTRNGVPVLPYVYGGGVDWNADDEYTESDLENFEAWLDANIPYDYNGPICLDMEGSWWPKFDWASTQQQMDVILDYYIQGLEYAKQMRPDAKFGYWGLPKKIQTSPTYDGPSIERLLRACGAIFPDTYEDNPGGNDAARLQRHVERTLEMVEGRVPVHVQMSPRFRDQELGGWRHFHEVDEIIRDQARPSLEARWQDDTGVYRVASVGLWDAYVYVRNYHDDWWSLTMEEVDELWIEVDEYHNAVYVAIEEVVAEYDTSGADKTDPNPGDEGPGIGGGKQNKTASR